MKSALRNILKKKREALENKEKSSKMIAQSFFSTDLYKNSESLLLYYSVGSEVSTRCILFKALEDKKRVAFPVCLNSDGVMKFYYINDAFDLQEDMYGIKAPKKSCIGFNNCKNALCVVPGLSFDSKGYRIGYGKGYYDRFLEGFEGISIGLCYEAMLEADLPKDKFDKAVDYLITDKKIYKF